MRQILKLQTCERVRLVADQIFHNFRVAKSVDPGILCISKTSIDIFRGSIFEKYSVVFTDSMAIRFFFNNLKFLNIGQRANSTTSRLFSPILMLIKERCGASDFF